MSAAKALVLLPFALAIGSCATPIRPAYPGVVSLTIVEPRKDRGPIMLEEPGQAPVKLSESGVVGETVGSAR